MKMKGLKRAFSAFLAISLLTVSVHASGFATADNYIGIGKIVMDMAISEDELSGVKAEAKAELEALGADTAYNLSLVDLAESINAIYTVVDSAATETGAEIINLPYNNTYSLSDAEILYEGVSENGKALSDSSVIAYASSVITADGLGRAIVKAGTKKYLIKTEKADIALVLVSGQSNAAGAESDASLAPSALGKYKGRFLITNSMNQAVNLSDITWEEAKYEAEHGGAPSASVAQGAWATTDRSAGAVNGLAARLSDEWDMTVWAVNTGFGGHTIEGFDPERASHPDYTDTVNIVNRVKEVIASDRHYVLDNSKTGLFWIQGCSDGIGTESENTMAEYKTMFMNMYNGFKTELGINYVGIWLVRAGTYNNGDKDFYMSGPRMAQIYMANSNAEAYKNIHLVFNTDIWRTDAGVKAHFEERHPDADAFKSCYGYDRPTTVNEVKPDIHYRQKGYNELGDIAGEVMSDILSGNAATPASAELFGYDGNKIPDTGFEFESEESAIAVPFDTSHYYNASANLTVTVANTNVATYDNETFTLKGVAEGKTTVGIYAGATLLKSYPVKVMSEDEEIISDCYVGDNAYDKITLKEAIEKAPSGSVIHLVRDVTLTETVMLNRIGVSLTLDGTNGDGMYKIEFPIGAEEELASANKRIFHIRNGHLTLSNVILSGGMHKDYGGSVIVEEASCSLTLTGKTEIRGAKATNGGALWVRKGTLTVKDDALITENTAQIHGGAIYLTTDGGKIHLEGGKITNNYGPGGGGIYAGANTNIYLKNNACVYGNIANKETGAESNIIPKNAEIIVLNDSFTGKAGVSYGKLKEVFGKKTGGDGEYNLISDTNGEHFGYSEDGKLIWIPGQLKLSVEADAGVRADGSATIRFITNFEKADNLNALSYGTYIIPESLFADFEKDVYGNTEDSLKVYFVSAEKGGANYTAPSTGKSFGVDYVKIPERAFSMEFVAVSFINLDGTYIYINHGSVSVDGFGENLKELD